MPESSPYRLRLATAADRSEWPRMRFLLWPNERPDQLESDIDAMLQDPHTPVFVTHFALCYKETEPLIHFAKTL